MIPRLTPGRRGLIVAALGSSLTVSWASSYYIPAVLAVPMAEDLGLSPVWVFGAFSMAMVVSAMVGPWAGGRIDGAGGRGVLMLSNLVFAAGLLLLAVAPTPVCPVIAGWAVDRARHGESGSYGGGPSHAGPGSTGQGTRAADPPESPSSPGFAQHCGHLAALGAEKKCWATLGPGRRGLPSVGPPESSWSWPCPLNALPAGKARRTRPPRRAEPCPRAAHHAVPALAGLWGLSAFRLSPRPGLTSTAHGRAPAPGLLQAPQEPARPVPAIRRAGAASIGPGARSAGAGDAGGFGLPMRRYSTSSSSDTGWLAGGASRMAAVADWWSFRGPAALMPSPTPANGAGNGNHEHRQGQNACPFALFGFGGIPGGGSAGSNAPHGGFLRRRRLSIFRRRP